MKIILTLLVLSFLQTTEVSLEKLSSYEDVDTAEIFSDEELLRLGIDFEFAEGVPQDYRQAAYFYRLAVDLGNAQAMHNLGGLYNEGKGVTQSRTKALELWHKASASGNSFSSFNLGNAYHTGYGVDKNVKTAADFYFLSYSQGYKPAACQFSNLITIDLDLKREQFDELLAEDSVYKSVDCMFNIAVALYDLRHKLNYEEKYLSLLEKSYAMNSEHASTNMLMAIIYSNGETALGYDPETAKKHYLVAGKFGIADAYSNLGFMYESGMLDNRDFVTNSEESGAADYVSAKTYYDLGMEMGSVWAINNLGTFYREGKAVAQDLNKALELFTKAASFENAYAYKNLGVMYRNGEGTEINEELAKLYFDKAISLNFYDAYIELALIHSDKNSIYYDVNLAIDFAKQAVDKNVPSAAELLSRLYQGESREYFALDTDDDEVAYSLAQHYEQELNDIAKACLWYDIAIQRSSRIALVDLVRCLDQKNYKSDTFTSIEQVVRKWSIDNQANADSVLGELYFRGEGVAVNYAKAFVYFKKAIEIDSDPIAFNLIGNIYRDGLSVNVDYSQAIKFYTKSADGDLSRGHYNLALMYKKGLGVQVNEERAFQIMKVAAEYKLDEDAMFEYAKMLNSGYAGKLNIEESHQWFERARLRYHATAHCYLGNSLRTNGQSDADFARSKQLLADCADN